jgi:Putative peptidoglycan binding domain
MWIWYVSKASGGKLSAIISTARRYHIGTLMIKSGDGSDRWSQFSRKLVRTLHAAGLEVCAWQYVYGNHPIAEAKVGAAAVQNGADCLLIDAEADYEGKYVRAQQYIRELRHLIGTKFPVGLASFPYVDYHPSLPYSVFMGPGAAQYDVPQMYWPDIRTTVDTVYSHTYSFNDPYVRPIAPLGEVAGDPAPRQVERFRKLARVYGATGVSWWDWQESSVRDWQAVGATVGNLNAQPLVELPILSRHGKATINRGDLVVWAQEHLLSAGYHVRIDGVFGTQMQSDVRSFQAAHGLSGTGRVDAATWLYLLGYPAARVTWTSQGARPARATTASPRDGLVLPPPRSARLGAVRYEIPAHFGAG